MGGRRRLAGRHAAADHFADRQDWAERICGGEYVPLNMLPGTGVSSETRRFDVEMPIAIDNQIYGRLQFGLSTEFLHAARTKLVRESVAIAVIEIALSLLLLTLLGA